MTQKNDVSELNYDEVLDYIGQFGRFQKRTFFLLCLVAAAGGIAVMVFAFTGPRTAKPNCFMSFTYQVWSPTTDAESQSVTSQMQHILTPYKATKICHLGTRSHRLHPRIGAEKCR